MYDYNPVLLEQWKVASRESLITEIRVRSERIKEFETQSDERDQGHKLVSERRRRQRTKTTLMWVGVLIASLVVWHWSDRALAVIWLVYCFWRTFSDDHLSSPE